MKVFFAATKPDATQRTGEPRGENATKLHRIYLQSFGSGGGQF